MKEGDFLRVDYIGRIKESGLIFDLTKEDVAKEEKIFNSNMSYRPIPVIIGSKFLIKGLEDALKAMKVGEKKHIELKPEKAFGPRSEKLIKTLPESEFTNQDMVPYQGMPVRIKGLQGRVLSVSGGRVKVDFNHPLAGKELEYDLEVKDKITKKDDQIISIVEVFSQPTGKEKVNVDGNEVEIKLDPSTDLPAKVKREISKVISKWVNGIEKIRFIEEYSSNMTGKTENKKSEKKQ